MTAQGGEFGGDRRKRLAVVDGRVRAGQGREMLGHAVAHMPLKTIARVRKAKPGHQTVAGDFRHDRGGRNGHDQRIAGHHGFAIAAAVDLLIAVDEHQFGPYRQRLDRAGKRPERGAKDVVAVDALDRAECHGHLCGCANFLVELFARSASSFLESLRPRGMRLRIEHHRGCHNRAGERPPPRFIAAGNGKMPLLSARRSRRNVGRRIGLIERQTQR